MQEQQQKDIATILAGTAAKASGSTLGYEIGRERGTDNLFVRIVSNDGGGTFTKAWQPVKALRSALSPFAAEGKGLRFPQALGPAIPQKGRNNAPFVGYVLAGIGFLAPNPEKPGEYFTAGDWKAWEAKMLALTVPPPPPPSEPEKKEGGEEPPSKARGKSKRSQKQEDTAPAGEAETNVIPVHSEPSE